MTRIAFIGAGSVVFTKNLLTDIFSFPELKGTTIALHDIDPERLETAGMMARWTSEQLDAGAKVEEHPVDGVLVERAGEDGQVAEVTLMMRPLAQLQAAVARMARALADRA